MSRSPRRVRYENSNRNVLQQQHTITDYDDECEDLQMECEDDLFMQNNCNNNFMMEQQQRI